MCVMCNVCNVFCVIGVMCKKIECVKELNVRVSTRTFKSFTHSILLHYTTIYIHKSCKDSVW